LYDPFEYLMLRHKEGLLKTDFKSPLGKVSYHIPCHSRVQNIGREDRGGAEAGAGATVDTMERCSGHDGTWGVKEEYYAMSMKIGKPVFKAMAKDEPDYVSSDCAIAGRHILQGMNEAGATPDMQGEAASTDPAAHCLRTEITDETHTRLPPHARSLCQSAPRHARTSTGNQKTAAHISRRTCRADF
jgi:Fe-S oxidoreductase